MTLGLVRTADHRYSFDDGQRQFGPFPGVTGIIRILDKSGPLVGWAKRITAEFAVDNLPWVNETNGLVGRTETVNLIKARAQAEKDAGAALGSQIHLLVEGVARGLELTELSEVEQPYVDAYRRWLADYQPRLVSLEKSVMNVGAGYGGTFDIIADLDGVRWLIDVKTNRPSGDNRGLYSETALQLAAYANATFIGLPGDPRKFPMPRIRRYGVLHLRPDAYPDKGYRLCEYNVTQAEFDAFLHALHLTRWRREREAYVIGDTVPVKEKV